MENDRIFVNASYMADSVEIHWAAAHDGITSRGDEPDYDGEILVHMDGAATIKWWEGEGDAAECFVLVVDPQRKSGSYVTVYETEDQPPAPGDKIAWSPTFPDGR